LIDGQAYPKQFGTAIQEVVAADSDITGTFANEEVGINTNYYLALDLQRQSNLINW
jgi:trigger factor